MLNGDNKMKMKRDNVRIIRIILDLHGAIVDARWIWKASFFLSWKLVEAWSNLIAKICFPRIVITHTKILPY